jgi:regulator of CtrA degradation
MDGFSSLGINPNSARLQHDKDETVRTALTSQVLMVMDQMNNRDTKLSTIAFGDPFAMSRAFQALFDEGMALVEEAAAFLDGPGREQSRFLPRIVALTYSTESMRLTTRLMQIASWLLVYRAVSCGEMTMEEAASQKCRIHHEPASQSSPDMFEQLPPELRHLIARSLRLQKRIRHIDAPSTQRFEPDSTLDNPVAAQQDALRSAFGANVTSLYPKQS